MMKRAKFDKKSDNVVKYQFAVPKHKQPRFQVSERRFKTKHPLPAAENLFLNPPKTTLPWRLLGLGIYFWTDRDFVLRLERNENKWGSWNALLVSRRPISGKRHTVYTAIYNEPDEQAAKAFMEFSLRHYRRQLERR